MQVTPRLIAIDFSCYNVRNPVGIGFRLAFRCPSKALVTSCARQLLSPLETDGNHPPTVISAPGRRIVAIGDVHGDLQQTKRALRLAGVLSDDNVEDNWTGDSTVNSHSCLAFVQLSLSFLCLDITPCVQVLVQVGDMLDRGADEIAIMSLFWHLSEQARSNGGAVFQINGNHETMNVSQEFCDTSVTGFEDSEYFADYCRDQHDGDWRSAFVEWRVAFREWKESRPQRVSWFPLWKFLKGTKKDARAMLFSPGGPMAIELARHGVVLNVNGWLFAHGGLLPHHVAYGLERMNSQVSSWMKGELNGRQPFLATRGFDSIVWSRIYSRKSKEIPQAKACSILEQTLKAANAKGLVVGHTPQKMGANSECNGRVWRIDVGMSSGVLNATPQVIEIVNDDVKVLSC